LVQKVRTEKTVKNTACERQLTRHFPTYTRVSQSNPRVQLAKSESYNSLKTERELV